MLIYLFNNLICYDKYFSCESHIHNNERTKSTKQNYLKLKIR